MIDELVQECVDHCGSAIPLMFQRAGILPRVPRELVLDVAVKMAPVYRDLPTRALDTLDAADRAASTQTPPIH